METPSAIKVAITELQDKTKLNTERINLIQNKLQDELNVIKIEIQTIDKKCCNIDNLKNSHIDFTKSFNSTTHKIKEKFEDLSNVINELKNSIEKCKVECKNDLVNNITEIETKLNSIVTDIQLVSDNMKTIINTHNDNNYRTTSTLKTDLERLDIKCNVTIHDLDINKVECQTMNCKIYEVENKVKQLETNIQNLF